MEEFLKFIAGILEVEKDTLSLDTEQSDVGFFNAAASGGRN